IPDSAAAIRYAGDEFVLLIKSVNPEDIKAIETKITNALQTFNETAGRAYMLSLSMGHGIYTPGTSTQDSFLEEIDRNMYEQKVLRHQSGVLKDRRH
ncbi:MAG: diguanylate cyclase, partial [Clostridia bacterium]|nr:diguanylate cyclase [Clostridia bacterium]